MDWLTRGKSPGELGQGTTWQTGLAFLQLPVDDWPVSCETNIENLSEWHSKVTLAAESKEVDTLAYRINISRFSKIRMLLNTMARILNLYKRYKNQNDAMRKCELGELAVSDLEDAETFWILDAQSVICSAVKEGKLLRLCPRYRNRIIVVGSRAERLVQATWKKQEFILLPHNHRLSHLIAESEHAKGGHLGVSSTVAKIRSRFWIINVQKIVQSICNKCRKKFKMLCGQAMKNLPVEIQLSPPFTNVGVDLFGPFTITGEVQKRTRGKCFGVIFTCFTCRVVYVDVRSDYSTDSFLQVLRRFASVRGWPWKVYSDNGTQLVAASKELKDVVKGLEEATL